MTLSGWCTAPAGFKAQHHLCRSHACTCGCPHVGRTPATSHRERPNSRSVDTDTNAPATGAQP